MAIVKGQWYQWKLYPDHFYRVTVVSAYVQLYPYDSTRYQTMNVSQAYLQANFRLLASSPQYFLLDGGAAGNASTTRAVVLDDLVVWGSVQSTSHAPHTTALLDTTLHGIVRERLEITKSRIFLSVLQTHGNVLSHSRVIGNFTPAPTVGGQVTAHSGIKGSDFTVYPLGGYVAATGRVVQAQAN
jgi:hypothetical protein